MKQSPNITYFKEHVAGILNGLKHFGVCNLKLIASGLQVFFCAEKKINRTDIELHFLRLTYKTMNSALFLSGKVQRAKMLVKREEIIERRIRAKTPTQP